MHDSSGVGWHKLVTYLGGLDLVINQDTSVL